MDAPAEPTYAELRDLRAREWSVAQTLVAKEHADLQEKLQRMPDLVAPPSPWTNEAIVCSRCSDTVYTIRRWVTLSGKRYRAELECVADRTVGTWDFGAKKWIG